MPIRWVDHRLNLQEVLSLLCEGEHKNILVLDFPGSCMGFGPNEDDRFATVWVSGYAMDVELNGNINIVGLLVQRATDPFISQDGERVFQVRCKVSIATWSLIFCGIGWVHRGAWSAMLDL